MFIFLKIAQFIADSIKNRPWCQAALSIFKQVSVKSPRSFSIAHPQLVYTCFCYSFCLCFAWWYSLLSFYTDIDECENRDTCQHECKNTFGSYRCICPPGYQLMLNGKTCQGETTWGRLLLQLDLKTSIGKCEKLNVFFFQKNSSPSCFLFFLIPVDLTDLESLLLQ